MLPAQENVVNTTMHRLIQLYIVAAAFQLENLLRSHAFVTTEIAVTLPWLARCALTD